MSLYDQVYRHMVFPYLDRKQGISRTMRELQNDLDVAGSNWPDVQTEHLRRLCRHAADTTTHWSNIFSAAGAPRPEQITIKDLALLPILEKSTLRENLDSLLSRAISRDQRTLSQTGGSTAAPTKFYRDHDCERRRVALRHLYWQWIGKSFYDRWGRVWGASQDLGSPGTKKQAIRDRLKDRCVVLHSNRMTKQDMTDFLLKLKRFKARFLHGYGQSIYALSLMLRNKPELRPDLDAITFAAEPVAPSQRQTIETSFQAPLYSHYGTRELGTIGAEIPNSSGMVIYPFSVVVEIVDSKGAPVEIGEIGHILVTDLWNFANPLIRYRIGDIGKLDLSTIEGQIQLPSVTIVGGRDQDFIATPDGRLVSGSILVTILNEGIAQFQFTQTTIQNVEVRYIKSDHFCAHTLKKVNDELCRLVSPQISYKFVEVREIVPNATGKLRIVISEIAQKLLSNMDPSEQTSTARIVDVEL